MIFADSLPFAKSFFAGLQLSAASLYLFVRCVANCIHGGESAAEAADMIRTQRRHRGQITRFLARQNWSNNWDTLARCADLLLKRVYDEKGTWVFILDQTYHTTYGKCVENTFSHANKKKKSKAKSKRAQHKTNTHTCHCFVFGLLISPVSGTRLPFVRSYYTDNYCQLMAQKAQKAARDPRSRATPPVLPTYKSQTDLAAEMILQVSPPTGNPVLVLGDTAFEAKQIQAACRQKHFDWVVPANPERVLSQKGKDRRPKLRSHCTHLSPETSTPITLVPGQTDWSNHQRGCITKAGKTRYARRYWARAETLEVHNVGQVQVVFSTTNEPKVGCPSAVQKVLLCNRTDWDAGAVVSAYSVRWQIEQFFREMKSDLGLSRYRFRSFAEVEGWVQICCIAFVYLEWYRHEAAEPTRGFGHQRQRTSGLAKAVRREIVNLDLSELAERIEKPSQLAALRAQLRRTAPRKSATTRNAS